jgi:hypothetical protein
MPQINNHPIGETLPNMITLMPNDHMYRQGTIEVLMQGIKRNIFLRSRDVQFLALNFKLQNF